MTQLAFKSRYRGNTSFVVIGGPMAGQRIKLTDSNAGFFERDWNGGKDWNLSRTEYVRDIIGGAGMLTCSQQSVTTDVMDAYKKHALAEIDLAQTYARKHGIESMDSIYFENMRAEVTAVQTGYWDNGWYRTLEKQEETCS